LRSVTLAGIFLEFARSHRQRLFRWSEWIPVISCGFAVGFLLALLLLDERHGFLWLTAGVLFFADAGRQTRFSLARMGRLARTYREPLSEYPQRCSPSFAPLLLLNHSVLGFIGILAMERTNRK
jgi:hypothetical protein